MFDRWCYVWASTGRSDENVTEETSAAYWSDRKSAGMGVHSRSPSETITFKKGILDQIKRQCQVCRFIRITQLLIWSRITYLTVFVSDKGREYRARFVADLYWTACNDPWNEYRLCRSNYVVISFFWICLMGFRVGVCDDSVTPPSLQYVEIFWHRYLVILSKTVEKFPFLPRPG